MSKSRVGHAEFLNDDEGVHKGQQKRKTYHSYVYIYVYIYIYIYIQGVAKK